MQNLLFDDQRERTVRLAKTNEVAKGETQSIVAVLRQIGEERRLDLEPGSPEFRKLGHGI
jgi:hypothetical protein